MDVAAIVKTKGGDLHPSGELQDRPDHQGKDKSKKT